jgi:hypothetical protein
MTRKFLGDMMRKLSVTESRNRGSCPIASALGTASDELDRCPPLRCDQQYRSPILALSPTTKWKTSSGALKLAHSERTNMAALCA